MAVYADYRPKCGGLPAHFNDVVPWPPRNDLLPDADLVSPVAQYTAGTALAHQWTRATPQRGTRRRPAGVPPGFCDAGRLSDGAAQRHAGRVSATEYGGDADLSP